MTHGQGSGPPWVWAQGRRRMDNHTDHFQRKAVAPAYIFSYTFAHVLGPCSKKQSHACQIEVGLRQMGGGHSKGTGI